MSTVDPIGDGGGGGRGTSTSVENKAIPSGTPSTDVTLPAGSQHPQHPPPSPLSGCYLLVVLPEPHTAQHKDLILNRLAKGFLSWDKDSCHVDLEKELQALVAQAPEGEEARNGERLIQYATENLVTEVLIHPQTNTLLQCIRNLLASFTKHRHIIHAGYTFGGNGSWILQDGTFSLADFLDAFSEHEVQRVLRAYENSVTVDVNCAGVGEWSTGRLSKEACTRSCRVRLNPDDVLTAGVAAIVSFTNYVGQYLLPQTLDQLMEPSDLVGNIRFSHPTLYVFPGGQGDAALFGINGFNMLVDGGFARKACFWDFARHLDRLDAVLVTRVNNSNVGGMSSVLRKKREMHVYPQIGHFFCNLVERRHTNSPDGDKDLDPLTLNLIDIGQEMMVDLRQINLRTHPCYRDPNPINLYHKVGHGTLDMYVLSPSKDSREVREFISKWHSADAKLFAGSHKKDSNNMTFPIQNLASICALLVWQPANPEDTITRILFPGSTPQQKIFEGFERLKHLDFLKHPVCSAKSLSPSTSLLALKDRPTMKQKLSLIDKDSKKSLETKREKRDHPESKLSKQRTEITEDTVPKSIPQTTPIITLPKAQPAKIDVKTKKVMENKKMDTEIKKLDKDLKETKRESGKNKDVAKIDKDVETKKLETASRIIIKSDNEKTVPVRDIKGKGEPRRKDGKPGKTSKTIEIPTKSVVKVTDKKAKPTLVADKKDLVRGSPQTPKKMVNVPSGKPEIAGKTTTPRLITKTGGKQPPSGLASSMPAKSAKDANNRKVVEQKNIEIASAASAAAATVGSAKSTVAKPKAPERKPISRRGKPPSPSKPARVPGGSPAKSSRSTPTTSVKSDKDGVIRRVKGDRGTTDSSAVSTPSAGIDMDSMTKLADKSLTEKSEDMSLDSIESKVLADLKEEREVVEEIEAVLKKAERIEGTRKDDHLDGDDDITAEATDKKEDDMTEDDVTADMEEVMAPAKKSSRKPSQELTEEDEYLIVEKEEIYIEDSGQSGDGTEQKHVLDAVQSEKIKSTGRTETGSKEEEQMEIFEEEEQPEIFEEDEEVEILEEKEKSDVPEKKLVSVYGYDEQTTGKDYQPDEISSGHKKQLEQRMIDTVASAADTVERIEDKDDSGKKDSEDMTKEPSSLSPDKFDSSEKKTTDTDPMKPEADQRDQQVVEKLEESQERMSTMESGATTTAPTLPEDERIPLDDIKEVIDEKYIADEETKKDSVHLDKHTYPTPIPTESKPDVQCFQVRPTVPGTIHREIVKTPDEVADLPVHEEVDPKLYRMEHFDKPKEEKLTSQQQQQQQPDTTKDPPTPTVKEQKGVFSFFGKVADKFEKGIDKLTGKSRRDSEKDIDERSSSKSSSPKEPKPHEIVLPGEGVRAHDAISSRPEQLETFEHTKPDMSHVRKATITDTAGFLQREIEDLKVDGTEKVYTKAESTPVPLSDPVFETCVLRGQQKDIITASTGQVEDDAEDVEALLEEASKKFKTVKDSLRDSLESLEDKIVEEEMVRAELAAPSKDVVKHTLSEVVEKLEEIKPCTDESPGLATKQPEKVKFDIPKVEDAFEDEDDQTDVKKDFKEAVRDVGEVLAGTAGILIEDKLQDVEEIVKKVAAELKRDDFLSHDALFKEDISKSDVKMTGGQPASSEAIVEEIISKQVCITEQVSPSEKMERIETNDDTMVEEPSVRPEIYEKTCIKTIATTKIDVPSPTDGDIAADKIDARKICLDLMDEQTAVVSSKVEPSITKENETAQSDVMKDGVESVCVKEQVKHRASQEIGEPRVIKGSDIVFDRKLSPDEAQIVTVTPDSMPTSPKFPGTDFKPDTKYTAQIPNDVRNELDEEGPLDNIIEKLLFVKKTKITIEIVEYIIVTRKIPREKIIHIIEEIIIKRGVTRDSVVADIDLLTSDTASGEQRADIERYIYDEYVKKNKKITIEIVEEISTKKFISRRTVIEIIEEIIVKKKISRDAILDISETELSFLIDGCRPGNITGGYASTVESPTRSRDIQVDDNLEIDKPSLTNVKFDIERYVLDNVIANGKKITSRLIDDITIAKNLPKRLFVEIIEEMIIKRNIPRSSILDISEKELSNLVQSEKDDMDRDEFNTEINAEQHLDQISISSNEREQIEKNITDNYLMKNRRITPYILDEISVNNGISRRIILQIVEELAVKSNVPRSSIIDISEIELGKLLAAETEIEEKECISGVDKEVDHPEHGIVKYESVTPENLSEIENGIIQEFVSKSRKITPYVFEDICIRYRIPRCILIKLIENIIVDKKIDRDSIIDITDIELSELLVAAEAETSDQAELDVGPMVSKRDFTVTEDIDDDKLIDGFVTIPVKDTAVPESVSSSITVESAEQALIDESERYLTDDFEAVEQEYKIHGTPITTTKESLSILPPGKSNEIKISDGTEEAIEDDVSDVVEADEKTSDLVAPITIGTLVTKKQSDSILETSKAYDPMEKDLIEIQKEIHSPDRTDRPAKTLDEEMDDSIANRRHSVAVPDDEKNFVGKQITSSESQTVQKASGETVHPQTQAKKDTDRDNSSIVTLEKEETKSMEREFGAQASVTEPEIDILRIKRSIDDLNQQRKDSLLTEKNIDRSSTIKSESPENKTSDEITGDGDDPGSTNTVRRMLVTASSEDGGHETEVCPTGSIIFTKTTPDDSLKSSPVKTTPDQDSLVLDKESLRSGASTPEKDSMSDKSTLVTKDGDRISPDDSLDKSPSVAKDSHDLEDSLEKALPTKTTQVETRRSPTQEKQDGIVDSTDTPIVHEVKESHINIREHELSAYKITEKDSQQLADATLSNAFIKTIDRKASVDRSVRSSNIAADGLGERDDPMSDGKSESHSVASDEERSNLVDRSEFSTIVSGKIDEKPSVEESQPLRAYSDDYSSMAASKPEENLRSPGSAREEPGNADSSLKSNVATGDAMIEKDLTDVHMDRHSEKATSDIDDKSRSPSVVSETHIARELVERSRSPSVAGEMIPEKDGTDLVDETKSPSIVDGSDHGAASADRSKSSSTGVDRQSEKAISEIEDKGRSPSVASETHVSIESTNHSRSPSLVGDKITETDVTEMDDKTEPPNIVGDSDLDRASSGRSNTPSFAGDRHSDKATLEIEVKSRSPSIVGETHDVGELIERPISPGISSGDNIAETDATELVDKTKSPSIVDENDHSGASADRSKSPSIAGDRNTEKATSEIEDKSRSPSVASETHGVEELTERPRLPGIGSDKIAEKDATKLVDRTKSPTMVNASDHDKASADRSKSPSIAGDRQSEKTISEIEDKSRSPSIASETHVSIESTDHLRSPSVVGDKISEKDATEMVDETKSPSIVDEGDHDETSGGRSKSPSIAVDRQNEKTILDIEDKSRSPSVASETHVSIGTTDHLRSPSVVRNETDVTEFGDKAELSSIVSDSDHDKPSADRSKSPSIAGDRQNEKAISEIEVKSRSPSIPSETHVSIESTDHLRSPSVVGDKIPEKNATEMVDETKSPSIVDESDHDETSGGRSKSPSIGVDRQSEKTISDMEDKSRSPSVASETHVSIGTTDHLRSPSVVGNKITETDVTEFGDKAELSSIVGDSDHDKASAERPKSPCISGDKIAEKGATELVDKTKSPSIVDESDHEKTSADRSKSPSIAGDRQNEKAISEIEDKSRSPSIASETHVSIESTDHLRSSSVVGDKISEKDATKIVGETKSPSIVDEGEHDETSGGRSKSPSIGVDRQSEKTISDIEDKSRSPSVASETHVSIGTTDHLRSPSVVGNEITETDVTEFGDKAELSSIVSDSDHDKASADRSKSPSIAGDRQNEKAISEIEVKSRSSSVASETHVSIESTDHFKSPSVVGDKISEKDATPMVDETKSPSIVDASADDKTSTGPLKSPSIAVDRQSEKTISDIEDKSRSPSIASVTHVSIESTDHFRSPSVVGDKVTETDVTEMGDKTEPPNIVGDSDLDRASADRSKSPSIAGDRHSEKVISEIKDKSRSPSVASEPHGDRELTERPISPCISGDNISKKRATELVDKTELPSIVNESDHDKTSADRSKSPSIAGDRQSEKAIPEIEDKSRSSSVASETHVIIESTDHLRSLSVVGDKISEKDGTEMVDETKSPSIVDEGEHDKTSAGPLKSPSIAVDRQSEKTISDIEDKSRSPSVASETHVSVGTTDHDKASADRSKSPSIAGDRPNEKAISDIEDKSRSPSVASETHVSIESTDHLRSPSVVGDKIPEKNATEMVDETKSPSIVDGSDHDKTFASRSKSPSIAVDLQSEKTISDIEEKSRSPSIASETHVNMESTDHSRSPSVVGDKISEKNATEMVDETKSPSIVDGSDQDKTSASRSKSPSIAVDLQSEKTISDIEDKSRSPSIVSETQVSIGTTDHLRSPSVVGNEITETGVTVFGDKAEPFSVVGDSDHDKTSADRSKSPSVASDRQNEKATSEIEDKSRSPSIVSETHSVGELIERPTSHGIGSDNIAETDSTELVDKAEPSSIVGDSDHDEASAGRSKSPSIAGDRHSEKANSAIEDKSRSPSVASETHGVGELIERPRLPGIGSDIIAETDATKPVDRTKSPSIVNESDHDKTSADRSKSPSIAGDRQSEKAIPEIEDKSRSSSVASETHVIIESTDHLRSPSVVGDKISEKDGTEMVDETKSPSIVDEGEHDKTSAGPLKSPSIAVDRQSEKTISDIEDKSRSPSIASETHVGVELTDHSRSLSIVGERHSEKAETQVDEKSRSPSIASQTSVVNKRIDRSRSPSVAGDKITENDSTEVVHVIKSPSVVDESHYDKTSPVRSKSPDIVGDHQSMKAVTEINDNSRSFSTASEKHIPKEVAERTRSPSVTHDEISEKNSTELVDETEPSNIYDGSDHEQAHAHRSKSPSIIGDRHSEKSAWEIDDKSRSPSIPREIHISEELTKRSRSPSPTGAETTEHDLREIDVKTKLPNVVGEIDRDKPSADRSKSPSIASDHHSDKVFSEIDDRFKSRSPSVTGDIISEKDAIELANETVSPTALDDVDNDKVTDDRSKSPTNAGDRHGENTALESDVKSRSPSIVSVTNVSEDRTQLSGSPSVPVAKIIKDIEASVYSSKSPSSSVSNRDQDEPPADRSKSSNIVGDRYSEQERSEIDIKSRSPSVAGDEISEKDLTKTDDGIKSLSIFSSSDHEQALADCLKSPAVATDHRSEGAALETDDKSRSSSISRDTRGAEELIQRSRLASAVDDKITKSGGTELGDETKLLGLISLSDGDPDKASADRSEPLSIVSDNNSEKAATEIDDKSRSPSLDGDKISEKDVKELVDETILPRVVDKVDHDKISADRSESLSITGNLHSEKSASLFDTKSRSPSIASETHVVNELTDRLRTTSVGGDEITEKDSRESVDETKSPSVVDDRREQHEASADPADDERIHERDNETGTTEVDIDLRLPSVDGDEDDVKKAIERPKIPMSGDDSETKRDLEALQNESESFAATGKNTKDTKPVDRSKSPSIISDTHNEITAPGTNKKSQSSNYANETHVNDPVIPSRTQSVASEESIEKSLKQILEEKTQNLGKEVLADESKCPIVARHDESFIIHTGDTSGELSVVNEQHSENYTRELNESRSPSNVYEKADEKLPIRLETSISVVAEANYAKAAVKPIDNFTSTVEPSKKADDLMDTTVLIENSDSAEMFDDENESLDRLSTSSIAGDEDDGKEISMESVLNDCRIAVDALKSPDKPISPSSGSVKYVQRQPIDLSKSSGTLDLSETTDHDNKGTHEYEEICMSTRPSTLPSDVPSVRRDYDSNDDDDNERMVFRRLNDESQSTCIVNAQDSKLDGRDAVQALQKLAETIADKSSASKQVIRSPIDESNDYVNQKDRSRSQSVFDAGDKTPLGRSRTASLFEDRPPECLSLRSEVKNVIQDPVGTYSRDETKSTKDGQSRKSSLRAGSDDEHTHSPICDHEISKRSKMENDEDNTEKLTDNYDATANLTSIIEEYIVNKYIKKKEKITSRDVDEIVAVYLMPKHIILELVEFIITKENVPRDFVVDYPKYDGTRDHVDVVDIAPAKRHDVKSYINEEFIEKNKKITSRLIDDLVTRESISRNIVMKIIEEIMIEKNIQRTELIDDGLINESSKISEADTRGPTTQTGRLFDDENLPSVSNDYNIGSQPLMSGSELGIAEESEISEEKRLKVESYIMDECVKKGKKITMLVLEEIITKLSISRSLLLDIIENIIVTRKMSRTTMVDEAIYDEVDTGTSKSSESLSTKDRIVAFSGKSTPDPKSSGYSTPETRQEMLYSTDFESPFHKAFVGGMTEIRTTHITTLSGKSTPDFGGRGETPEWVSDNMITGSEAKAEVKLEFEDESERTPTIQLIGETRDVASSITTTPVGMPTAATTTASSPLDSVLELKIAATSVVTEKPAGEYGFVSKGQSSDTLDAARIASHDTFEEEKHGGHMAPGKIMEQKVISEQEPAIITRVIRRTIIDEDGEDPERVEQPDIIRRVIRREIIEHEDEKDETGGGDEQHLPEVIETVTTKTTKTIVTENLPHYEKGETQGTVPEKISSESESAYVARIGTQDCPVGGSISADVKRTITTVTTVTEPDGKVTTKKNVQESTDTLEGEKLLEKLIDSTKSEDSGRLTDAKSIESLTTEKIITETIKTVSGSSASGIRGDFDRSKSSYDSASHDDKCDNVNRSTKISTESIDHPMSPLIKDLISEEKKSTSEMAVGSESRSGRSTPDKRGEYRSSTATPEGFRSSEVIRTTITTTRTMSDEGDIITTTKEITEATNEKGEVTILTEKTDVKVEASEDRHGYSDDEVAGSPLSTTSVVGYSPQSHYHFGEQGFDKESSHKTIEFSEADMSSSFYGELPDLPPRVTTLKTAGPPKTGGNETSGSIDPVTIDADFSFKKLIADKEDAGSEYGKLSGDRYVEDADLDVKNVLTGGDRTNTYVPDISNDTVETRCTDDNSTKPTMLDSSLGERSKKPEGDAITEAVTEPVIEAKTGLETETKAEVKSGAKSDAKADPLADWGTPLGLPSPKPPRKFNLRTTTRPNDCPDISPDSLNFDAINIWGEPLRLPSPVPTNDEASNKATPPTPKKDKKQPKKVVSENIKNRKRSESPSKNEKKTKDAKNKVQPVYMDLTYVPHHGNSYYTSLDFFKKVRARYYVFSGTEPSREVYDALLDAKKTWEDKNLEVTMIPTYDTDTLGYWVADNEEALAANHIDLSPSASRCTINLQDHETSCSAYRLEF